MIERYIRVKCDNCNEVMEFYNLQLFDVYTSIRSRTWAVSKDRRYTFCPKCKPKVSNVGRFGVSKLLPFSAVKEKDKQRDEDFLRQIEEHDRKIYEEECAEFARMNGD